MQLETEKYYDRQNVDAAVVAPSPVIDRRMKTDSSILDNLDVGLFKALRKLDTPKQRICSACWLSYEEYDEVSKLI